MKIFSFSGTAGRLEFLSVNIMVWALSYVSDEFVLKSFEKQLDVNSLTSFNLQLWLVVIYSLMIGGILLCLLMAVTFRRLHDMGKSGFWSLLFPIPAFVLLYLTLTNKIQIDIPLFYSFILAQLPTLALLIWPRVYGGNRYA